MTILVTGVAGFIGAAVADRLLDQGRRVIGLDSMNSYYPVALKQARLDRLLGRAGFGFHAMDVSDRDSMLALADAEPDITGIVHLAAQAGVRHSLIDPYAYVTANVMGQLVVLELARRLKRLRHTVYASSSSVYGGNTKLPLSVADRVDQPLSLYAATKRADELFAHTYSHLYGLPLTGLRFFTVYGPWGRPDMAPWQFTQAILAGEPIRVFNHGNQRRDFTYVDDVVDGVVAALDRVPGGYPPLALYNLGNSRPEPLMDFIGVLERLCGRPAVLTMEPAQPGDVTDTYADIAESTRDLGYAPRTGIEDGLDRFVTWFRRYHGV